MTHLPSLTRGVTRQCLAHVVASVGDTFQLPLTDVLIPVHISLQHLLHTHKTYSTLWLAYEVQSHTVAN
jgi:hypothetical protein